MTKQASRFIGSIPEHYDRYLGPRIFLEFALQLCAKTAALQPDSVLELAAGTGILTRQLRDALPGPCSLTATDLNPPMLEQARTKFEDHESVRLEPADATALPYKDSSFDVVACQFGVMFFPDKQRSYEEALRVLKPGGSYIFNVWGPLESNPFARIAHETVAASFPDNPPGFYKVPFGYSDAAIIERSMLEAGFAQVTIQVSNIRSDIPSAEDFATGLVFGNPLLEEINSRGGDPEPIRAAIAQTLDQQLGHSMPLQAFTIEARKD